MTTAVWLCWAALPINDAVGSWQAVKIDQKPVTPATNLGIMTLHLESGSRVLGTVENLDGSVSHRVEADGSLNVVVYRRVRGATCESVLTGTIQVEKESLFWNIKSSPKDPCGFTNRGEYREFRRIH
jgi:hypothetical protein